MKALILAEEFVVNHKAEAKSLIARKWNIDLELMRQAWDRTRLFVSFSQSIITALHGYVKWYMDYEGKTGDPPDVLRYIDPRPLEELDPGLITIFR